VFQFTKNYPLIGMYGFSTSDNSSIDGMSFITYDLNSDC